MNTQSVPQNTENSQMPDGRFFANLRNGVMTLTPIDDRAMLVTVEQIPKALRDERLISTEVLTEILNICLHRLDYRKRVGENIQ